MIIMEPELTPWQQSILDEVELLNEHLLRFTEKLDRLPVDRRATAIARTHLETATLWLGKAVSPWPRIPDAEPAQVPLPPEGPTT